MILAKVVVSSEGWTGGRFMFKFTPLAVGKIQLSQTGEFCPETFFASWPHVLPRGQLVSFRMDA